MSSTLDPKWGQPDATHDPAILAAFQARPDDVLITTAPKAGTTWMQQILHQLRTGGDPDFHSIDAVVPWLELPRSGKTVQEILAAYDAMPDPRIFKTHCTREQTPGVDVARIVLTSRDPRDSFVSYYHHVMDMTDEGKAQIGTDKLASLEDVFERWMKFAAWYRNVQSWWPHFNDRNVLWLRYEDMKRDLPASLDKLVAFLGWSVDARQRARVLEYSSFDWMKANSEKFARQGLSDKPLFKPGGFIRKGRVGEHKTRLSPAQEERILARAREMLAPDCLAFLGLK